MYKPSHGNGTFHTLIFTRNMSKLLNLDLLSLFYYKINRSAL